MTLENALRAVDGVVSVKTHDVRGSTYTAVRITTTDTTPTELIDRIQEVEATRPVHFDGAVYTEGNGRVIIEYEHP